MPLFPDPHRQKYIYPQQDAQKQQTHTTKEMPQTVVRGDDRAQLTENGVILLVLLLGTLLVSTKFFKAKMDYAIPIFAAAGLLIGAYGLAKETLVNHGPAGFLLAGVICAVLAAGIVGKEFS